MLAGIDCADPAGFYCIESMRACSGIYFQADLITIKPAIHMMFQFQLSNDPSKKLGFEVIDACEVYITLFDQFGYLYSLKQRFISL